MWYSWIIYNKQLNGTIDLTSDFKAWGSIFLIFMGVSIVARIVIYIVFHIVNAIATREDTIPKDDERDKLIKLKATRNSYYTFSALFSTGFLLLAVGMPIYGMLITFIVSGLIAEIVDNVSQIYFNRKGIS